MLVRPLSEGEQIQRQNLMAKIKTLQQAGICPTCQNLEMGDVYPPVDDRVFYEDELLSCFLESFPRNPGHTIILVKPHFEDISELPLDLTARVYPVIHGAIIALKKVLPAEKAYLCTMCDGRRNHLHFQLIPRLAGDEVTGSKLFVKERCLLVNYHEAVSQLRMEMMKYHGREKNKPAVFWIYILECENGNYYTGYTKDLVKRYQQHLNGTANSRYTRSFKPKRIAQCWQLFDTVGSALKVERFIKKQNKKTKALMIRYPDRLRGMVSEKIKIDLELLRYDTSGMVS